MKYRSDDGESAAPQGPVPLIFEAIVRKLCVGATYNKTMMTLAPHAIYTKHDDLFVDAEVIAREGMLPKEPKIGTFKLIGLNDLKLSTRSFRISTLFDPESFKYAESGLMMVEPEPEAVPA